jgi:UrcA family protein
MPHRRVQKEITMSRITQSLIGAALAVIVNAVAAFSLAGTPATTSEQHSLTVRYNDLSLARPADVVRLYHRIGTAADRVCGPRELTGQHWELRSYRSCFDLAVGNAVDAVASPSLSAYYRTQQAASHSHVSTVAQR